MKYPRFPKARLALIALVSACSLFAAVRSAEAKDEWLQVRSKNFYLIGNASEKDIRKVGTKLEQFRETFRQLFGRMNLVSPIPTNVVVFKSESAYKPFKPKRADGKIDNFVAGYFQPGEDVNYITLSTEGPDEDLYGTIFHEYVHFIVETNFGKSEIPPWFNEGLAEYYQTFAIAEDQKVKLGLPQGGHIELLRQSKFIPLDQLFKISNYQLHQTGSHSRSIFYAESWALMHYLIQGGKTDAIGKFLSLLMQGTQQEKAFQDAFQTTYAQMEKDLRKYVGQATYKYVEVTFKNKLTFDTEMQASALGEADTNAYLGDLLYHTNRADDAEAFLLNSLKLKPEASMANTTLGMVKIRQRKWDEARGYLEKAIAQDQKNHLAFYRYAYLLSREGRDEFGYVREFEAATASRIREALKKAIAINPAFTESYELLAFVNLVNNEEMDEAVSMLQTAMRYQPGNQKYSLRIAEIYSRQGKLAEATAIAEKIARTADDGEVRSRAENLASQIRQRQEIEERLAAQKKQYEQSAGTGRGTAPLLRRRSGETAATTAEIAKAMEEANIRSINETLRPAEDGEQRLVAHVQKIECRGAEIAYTVTTKDGSIKLTSKDFEGLHVNAFAAEANTVRIGCDEDISTMLAVVTYKPKAAAKSGVEGDLVGVEFVPKNFRLMTDEEISRAPIAIVEAPPGDQGPPSGAPVDLEAMRREAMMQGIRSAIREPQAGEKREMAFLDKIECTSKGVFFHMRTPTQTLKLLNPSPESLPIRVFTGELEGLRFGCGMKPVELPAVLIYADKPNPKAKTAGDVLSLDFVPKSFTLN